MLPQVDTRNLVNDYGPDDAVNPSGWAGSSGPSGYLEGVTPKADDGAQNRRNSGSSVVSR